MTINGGIPGPTIKAEEGDWVNIKVSNNMDVNTSIHWHGILFPGRNDQDGVPNLTTPPIKAHGSLKFRFPLKEFDSITGQSIKGVVNQHHIVIGNIHLFESLDIDTKKLKERAESFREDGATVVLVAVDNEITGLIAVADPIKETTKDAIDALHHDGLKVVMMTVDNRKCLSE